MKTTFLLAVTLVLGVSSGFAQSGAVATYHYDARRTGQSLGAKILVPANVKADRFGKLFSYSVDGFVVAQPLFVPNVAVPGFGTRNVVYVATQHDSVYAFDADKPGNGTALWHVNFLNSAEGVTTVPISEQLCSGTGFTEMGILGTPVIDLVSRTLYVSVKTREQSGSTINYVHRLHALDITTGSEKFGGPVVVVPNGQSGAFNTLAQCQRPALLLFGGVLYITYGSNGCDLRSHGWVLAYNPTTLQQLAAFNTSPNYTQGASIWQSGSGLAADSTGIYLSTANGPFDANAGGPDYGDTVLKLNYRSHAFTVADYFTPFDQEHMDNYDLDLGSGGVTLLPDQSGAHPHLLVTAGKTGTIYVIDRDNMGGYNYPTLNDSQIVQAIPAALGPFFNTPVYWNNLVYFASNKQPIKAYAVSNGQLSGTPVAQSFNYAIAGIPVISAHGNQSGILWNIHNPLNPVVSALDAITLEELYNSNQNSSRDSLGQIPHFANPMVANERVYVGTQTNLNVYGVFPFLAVTGGSGQSGQVGTKLGSPISVQATDSSGNGIAGVTVTFSDGNANGTFGSPTAVTNSSGIATSTYTLPTNAGTFKLTASANGYRNALPSVTAVAGPPSLVAKISGWGQTGTVGTTLPNPLVFKLRDAYNNPIVGQQIHFTSNGGGSFSSATLTTDASGMVSVSFTLPTIAKSVSVTATFGSLSATMAEKSVAGPASSLSIFSGNNQSGAVNTLLHSVLVVRVADQYSNPVAGKVVSFSDGGAGGTLGSATSTTNNVGQAYVSYRLPPQPKVVHIVASASGLSPVTFTETAN